MHNYSEEGRPVPVALEHHAEEPLIIPSTEELDTFWKRVETAVTTGSFVIPPRGLIIRSIEGPDWSTKTHTDPQTNETITWQATREFAIGTQTHASLEHLTLLEIAMLSVDGELIEEKVGDRSLFAQGFHGAGDEVVLVAGERPFPNFNLMVNIRHLLDTPDESLLWHMLTAITEQDRKRTQRSLNVLQTVDEQGKSGYEFSLVRTVDSE